MIKAIVFDLGGVVFHANMEDLEIFHKFLHLWNKAKVSEISCDEMYQEISHHTGEEVDLIKTKLVEKIKIDEEVKNLLLALNQNYKIGILTNTIEDIYEQQKELWDFEKVAEVITSFREHVAKPSEDAINLMLNKLGVEKDEIVFIDDHRDTVKRYSELGIQCIRFEGYKELLTKLQNMEIKI